MLAASLNHTWYSTEHFAAMIHEQRMSGASDRPMTGKEATAAKGPTLGSSSIGES